MRISSLERRDLNFDKVSAPKVQMRYNLEGRMALMWSFLVDLHGKRGQEMSDIIKGK